MSLSATGSLSFVSHLLYDFLSLARMQEPPQKVIKFFSSGFSHSGVDVEIGSDATRMFRLHKVYGEGVQG